MMISRSAQCLLATSAIFAAGLAVPATSLAAEVWKSHLWTGFEYQGDTDLDEGGDFRYWMISAGAGTTGKLSDRMVLSVKGDYRAVDYAFDLPSPTPDPWETVHVFRLNPLLTFLFHEHWSVFGGPIGEFSGEAGADFGDALRGGGAVGVGWRPNDRVKLALGALLLSEIEDDAYVQPFVTVSWGIAGGLALSVDADSSRGGELKLGYTFADTGLSLAVGGGFRRERFRLDDEGLGAARDGVGEEEATVLKGHIGYAFGERARIELYAGSTVDGEFRLEDDDGDKLADSDYDDAPFGGVNVTLFF